MANIIRIKRRVSGGAGAPSSLKTAELAWNMVDNTLYGGKGDDGGGDATSVVPLGGIGAFVALTGAQSIADIKTFTSSPVVPTVSSGDNSTKAASTAFVKAQNYLTANETITLSGDVTGSGTTAITTTLANSGVTTGTYTKVTVDAKGRVTVGANLSAGDIPTLTAAKISDFDTQVRTNRLDQMATPSSSVDMGNQRITNVGAPTSNSDAATKSYVDSMAAGTDFKESVRAATTANITLSGTQTIDGVSVVADDRVLVKNQSTAADNGIYVVAAGAWSRSDDAGTTGQLSSGAVTFVEEGSTNSGKQYVLTTTGTITIGTTGQTWSQFGGGTTYSAGNGLDLTGSTFSVDSEDTDNITVGAGGINLADTTVTPDTYKSVTVDQKGRITAGTNPTTLSGFGITDAQPLDATLTALAGMSTAANKFPYFTGVDTVVLGDITAFGRSLLDDADAATARTTLSLGTMATQAANNVAITGGSIDNVDMDGGTF